MDESKKIESKKKSLKNLRSINELNKDPEVMKQRNSKAGRISQQRRRERASMAAAMEVLLSLDATGKTQDMLKSMGITDEAQTNAMAFVANIFAEAMRGNVKAQEMILEYGLKVSEDERKSKESEARMMAIKNNMGDVTVTSSDGEDGDVLIYLPKLEETEEEVKDESVQTVPDKEE